MNESQLVRTIKAHIERGDKAKKIARAAILAVQPRFTGGPTDVGTILVAHAFGGWTEFPLFDVSRDGNWYAFRGERAPDGARRNADADAIADRSG